MEWPHDLEVLVEVSRGDHRKPRADGSTDFVSPLPSPFNYGSVLGTAGEDGDPQDVLILGPTLPVGTRGRFPVRGRVRFIDAGVQDDKWVVSAWPPSRGEWLAVRVFFRGYTRFKRVLYRLRRVRGRTAYLGLERR